MTKSLFQLGGDDPSPATWGSQGRAELDVESVGKFRVERVATIGRAPESHVVLSARSVSRHHARIFFEGGHFWIKDLESGNGTTVNGKKIKLQMLGDDDQIQFGEVNAVFRSANCASGPAPLAKDPLEDSDPLFQDGTPTGGLKGSFPSGAGEEYPVHGLDRTIEKLREEADGKEAELSALRQKIQTLQAENEVLRKELLQYGDMASNPNAGGPGSSGLEVENEKLRRLVHQLERALADSNLKLRNLQERLDRM